MDMHQKLGTFALILLCTTYFSPLLADAADSTSGIGSISGLAVILPAGGTPGTPASGGLYGYCDGNATSCIAATAMAPAYCSGICRCPAGYTRKEIRENSGNKIYSCKKN